MEGIINWRDSSETRTATVTVDGKAYVKVTRCSPGPNGWAEYLALDTKGQPYLGNDNELVVKTVTGFVEVLFRD